MTRTPPTRAEEIRQRLAEDIVHGRLAPGTPLEEIELARAFGVSRTPVREAIRQLEAEGFAHARPRRGAVVATISSERLQEMFVVMADLEALCAHHAATLMSRAERADLEAAQAACGRAVSSGDIEAYKAANERFHDALYRGAHNGFLAELTAGVRRKVAPFRRAQFHTLGRLQKSFAEHQAIVDAVLRGEAEKAAHAMRAHLMTVEKAAEEVAFGEIADAVPLKAASGA
jgi:DNA-binding GntR family transcriptional regulator